MKDLRGFGIEGIKVAEVSPDEGSCQARDPEECRCESIQELGWGEGREDGSKRVGELPMMKGGRAHKGTGDLPCARKDGRNLSTDKNKDA